MILNFLQLIDMHIESHIIHTTLPLSIKRHCYPPRGIRRIRPPTTRSGEGPPLAGALPDAVHGPHAPSSCGPSVHPGGPGWSTPARPTTSQQPQMPSFSAQLVHCIALHTFRLCNRQCCTLVCKTIVQKSLPLLLDRRQRCPHGEPPAVPARLIHQ